MDTHFVKLNQPNHQMKYMNNWCNILTIYTNKLTWKYKIVHTCIHLYTHIDDIHICIHTLVYNAHIYMHAYINSFLCSKLKFNWSSHTLNNHHELGTPIFTDIFFHHEIANSRGVSCNEPVILFKKWLCAEVAGSTYQVREVWLKDLYQNIILSVSKVSL